MRARRVTLLSCATIVFVVNNAYSLQVSLEQQRAFLRVVGGSIEKQRHGSSSPDHNDVGDEKDSESSSQPKKPTAFTRTAKADDPVTKEDSNKDDEVVPIEKPQRSKLDLGLGSSVLKRNVGRIVTNLGPPAMAFASLFYPSSDGTILLTKAAAYALALLGSSSGFYLFLYFITVGYALGVTLPVFVALIVYNLKTSVPLLTNIHSGLLILWCIRATWYFLYREYVNWPQLHEKVVEVNRLARPASKVFCWLVYSAFYVTLATPFLCRLEGAMVGTCSWRRLGLVAIGLQVFGLLLETVADQQKMTFKSQPGNRNRWCHVGVWRYSTHPNYAGENLFWLGSFLGGLSCYRSRLQLGMAIFGLFFISLILSGARVSLGSKHLRKYGSDVDFLEFRKTHGMWGPIPWRTTQEKQLVL